MTTGVALPLTLGFRMAGFRRGPPENLPQASHVRRNLFGPIDHEENLKFVQDELNKITQADCKRWNFDFQAEKPQEGRYSWEPVSEKVPQAYEMQAMCSHHLPQQTGEMTAASDRTPVTTQDHEPPHPYLTNPQAPPTTTTSIRTPTTVSTERRTTPTPTSVTTTITATTAAKKGTKRKAEDRTQNEGDRGGGGKRQKRESTQLQKPISAYMKITRRQKRKKEDSIHPTLTRTTATTPSTTTTATAATTTSTPDS